MENVELKMGDEVQTLMARGTPESHKTTQHVNYGVVHDFIRYVLKYARSISSLKFIKGIIVKSYRVQEQSRSVLLRFVNGSPADQVSVPYTPPSACTYKRFRDQPLAFGPLAITVIVG